MKKSRKSFCDDFTSRLMAFDKQVKDVISSLGLRGAAQVGSRAYIEARLLGKAGGVLCKFSSIAKNQGLAYAKKTGKIIKKFTEQERVAVASEGFVFPIVYQAYEYMDDAQKVAKKAAQITKSTGHQVVNATTKIIKLFFYAVLSEAELVLLQKNFKALIRYKGIVLEFCYEHLFNGEIGKNNKIGGLHHDYKGILQKSGILKLRNVKSFANGYYEAEIWNERRAEWFKKTFFPDHYTREDVMQRVVEAIGNPQVTRIEGSREVIKGLSSDGMIIRIVTQAAETITAYPDFKEVW